MDGVQGSHDGEVRRPQEAEPDGRDDLHGDGDGDGRVRVDEGEQSDADEHCSPSYDRLFTSS